MIRDMSLANINQEAGKQDYQQQLKNKFTLQRIEHLKNIIIEKKQDAKGALEMNWFETAQNKIKEAQVLHMKKNQLIKSLE